MKHYIPFSMYISLKGIFNILDVYIMSNRIFIPCMVAFLSSFYFSQTNAASTMENFTTEIPAGLQSAGDYESIASSTRDDNFNKVMTTSSNAGASASAIGNLINVEVGQGAKNNTIVIHASQINSGSQQASINGPMLKNMGSTNTSSSQSVIHLRQ
jgi:hypothetical protein